MKYYKPNWYSIGGNVDANASFKEQNTFWINECDKWLAQLASELASRTGESYSTVESQNFIILSSEDEKYTNHFLKFLEFSRTKILNNLKEVASDDGFAKHVLIITADQETYYDYLFMFYPEDSKVGLSGGVYLNDGYGHFVFPSQEISFTESVAAHELTHACLSHLPIPLWLNEGLAVSMEDVVLNRNYFQMNKAIISKHQRYWNEDNIQAFWDGSSFASTDVGQELSYHLGQLLVRNISEDYEQFARFCNDAHLSDGGEKAFLEHFNISLGDLIEGLLGDGDWSPKQKYQVDTDSEFQMNSSLN